MVRPRLAQALTWTKYEDAVLAVFEEGLRRLAARSELPLLEESLNFELFGVCLDVHWEFLQAERSIPFVIEFDSTNQPILDDTVRSRRLKKRPDFACAMTNPQAADGRASQIRYTLECKRLGKKKPGWVFNENYPQHGILRFVAEEYSYAKGSSSAAMIGYLQDMDPDLVLNEVNGFSATRNLPSLRKAAAAWASRNVTRLSQDPISRSFDPAPLTMKHLWVDLRQCAFVSPTVDDSGAKLEKKSKKKPGKK